MEDTYRTLPEAVVLFAGNVAWDKTEEEGKRRTMLRPVPVCGVVVSNCCEDIEWNDKPGKNFITPLENPPSQTRNNTKRRSI